MVEQRTMFFYYRIHYFYRSFGIYGELVYLGTQDLCTVQQAVRICHSPFNFISYKYLGTLLIFFFFFKKSLAIPYKYSILVNKSGY